MNKGGTQQFTATVDGMGNFDNTVTWKIENANSDSTTISEDGLLTVGTDETAASIAVIATANGDSTKSTTVSVVIPQTMSITGVTVSPDIAAIKQGETQQFTATVSGTGNFDNTVTWTVEGAVSTNTKIDENGKLTIGADETASSITVKAIANGDHTKSASVMVTVINKDIKVPVIGGIENGGKYCKSVTFTVTADNLDKVTVDGTEVTPNADGKYTITADDKAHTIIAKDTAGNVTKYTITVYTGHDFENPVYTETGREGNVITEEAPCGHGCGKKIVRKRTTEGDIISQEYPNDSGSNGSLAAEVKVASGAPAVHVSGLDLEIAKEVLDPSEISQVENGENLLVHLEINKLEETAVPAEDKTKTEEQAQKLQQGIYLDLSMWKKIGDAAAVPLGSTQISKN